MKSQRRATLQDIADQLGITKMTVSRYLRDPQKVAEKTRARIAQAIETSGYIQNRVPAMLSKSSSKAIGIVVPSLSNQVFAELVQGIEATTRKQGFSTLIAHTGYDPLTEEEQVAVLLSYQVDGLILTQTDHTIRTRKMLLAVGLPVAETMELPDEPIDIAVGLDHVAAATAATRRMIEAGRRAIVYLAARLDTRTLLRQQGYEQAMKHAGLKPVTVSTSAHSSFTTGASLIQQALTQYPELDGVFCTNDDLAVGVMLHCMSSGKTVPEDVAVVGYNGLDVGQAMQPKLTSVVTPRYRIGEVSADLLIRRIHGETLPASHVDVGFSFTDGATDTINA
ncbi:substrate-binding domain-containing protein [Alteromonas sp. H39]|uniref:substrate-binding domain-containing protein n=1 Tax=Alteromonas sp. H39 TaxID=3389876 RepID=UPI0039E02F24